MRIVSLAFSWAKVTRTSIRRLLRLSDYSRWGDTANLEKWWETRTQQIAALVPLGARVVEFGAGNCRLRAFLDESCQYVPSDIVNRSLDTIICDLNHHPLPDLSHVQPDVAVFAGVLEYVGDVETVAAWLSRLVQFCIASYDCVPRKLNFVGRLRERFRRLYYGYLSDLTEDQLRRAFQRQGFINTETDTWSTQRIFVFARGATVPASALAAVANLHCGAAQ